MFCFFCKRKTAYGMRISDWSSDVCASGLNAEPRVQLLRLCAASPWLTAFIAQSPVLLDTLLDPRALYELPGRDELHDELSRRTLELAPGDTEGGMGLLRRYQKEMTLRIAAADLSGALPLVQEIGRAHV